MIDALGETVPASVPEEWATATQPFLDSQPVENVVVARGDRETLKQRYEHCGALVLRDGEYMVITSFAEDQFHPRRDLLETGERL